MRDVDEGDANLLLDRLELDLHLLAELEVERAERLIEQQDAGPVDEGPGQRDPLPLATGELRGFPAPEARQPDHAQRFGDPAVALRPIDPPHHQPIADVLAHVHVREERVVLEDGVDIPVERRNTGHVATMEQDPPRGRPLETRDHAQRRRLS